tara:strand:+ start:272 stop:499 length:228 start_codon:yes stop_codon:yes gene_type:complete
MVMSNTKVMQGKVRLPHCVTLKRNTGKIPVAVSMSRASVRNAPMIKEPERSDRFMVDLLEEVRYANGPDLASISF